MCYVHATGHFTSSLCPCYRNCFSRNYLNWAARLYKDCQFPELKKGGNTPLLQLLRLKKKFLSEVNVKPP